MGFIANLTKSVMSDATARSRSAWRETFGTDKESPSEPPAPRPASSITTTDASMKKLLDTLKSRAPAGWSDDRWEQSRHFIGIAYVAIHRQNEQLSQAEFQVFRKSAEHPDGKVPVESDHPLVNLLSKPNPIDGFGDLMEHINLQLDLTGSGLIFLHMNMLGKPMGIYPMPTSQMIPGSTMSPEYPDGYYRAQPVYPYGPFTSYGAPTSATGTNVDARHVIAVRYPHPIIRNEGWSPLTAMRDHLDSIYSMDSSRNYKMKRSINPDAVLSFDDVEGAQPQMDDAVDRIVAQFDADVAGVANSGKLYVAPPGTKLDQWGTSPREMDYASSWDQLTSFVLGGFGITKPAAGMVEDSSYSTLFATLKQLYWLTLEPKVNRIGARLTRQLAPYFGDDLIIEIRCKRIDDHEVTQKEISTGIQAKCMTKNEVRKKLNMPITDEPWGEEIAGEPSQQGQDNNQIPGGPGQEPQNTPAGTVPAQGGAGGDLMGMLGIDNGTSPDNPEANAERDGPGSMSAGALGGKRFRMNGARLNGGH